MNLNNSGQQIEGEFAADATQQQENQETIDFLKQPVQSQYSAQQNSLPLHHIEIGETVQKDARRQIQSTVELIMQKIQLLDYQKTSFTPLSQQFKSITGQYIGFTQLLPYSKDLIGQKLLQDGLFHELWGIVCKKTYKKQQMQNYYQQYYHLLTKNHSNFERFYNNIDSSKEQSNEVQYDTATNLFPVKKTTHAPLRAQKKQKQELSLARKTPSFFDHIQTNQRRLKAQMVCYYLNLTSLYNLVDLNISQVLQFYHQNKKQLLVLSAQAPQFCQTLGKQVMDYRQKILIAMYGYVSFRQLLRIKRQYGNIDGFILYDELHNLSLWLKNNGYSDGF